MLWTSFLLIKSSRHSTFVNVRDGAHICIDVVMGRLRIETYAEPHNDGGWNCPSAPGGADSSVVDISETGRHVAQIGYSTVFLHCWAPFVAIVFCLRGTRSAYVVDDRRPELALIAA